MKKRSMTVRRCAASSCGTLILALLLQACFNDFYGNPVTPGDGDTDAEAPTDTDAESERDGETPEGDGLLCGNGVADEGEECDDGNGIDGDGCDGDCTFSCADGTACTDHEVCNGDETCDPLTHACLPGEARDDGTVCLGEPRRICLAGLCSDSSCGDGFVDTGGGEMCEPPGVDRCSPDCLLLCESAADCPDDGNPCNGDEFCDLDTSLCARGAPPPDGTACGAAMICLLGSCQESYCGDLYADAAAGEECDDGQDGDNEDGCRDDCAYTCHGGGECDDGRGCTDDMCDAEDTHACTHETVPDTAICRPQAGNCDIEERCDGLNPDCPVDLVQPGTTQCRPSAGDCDRAESCTGDRALCPDDAFADAGTTCRAAAGVCDVEETCTGLGPWCPVDALVPASTVCRTSSGACDTAEACTGSSADCPADVPPTLAWRTPASATASSEYGNQYRAVMAIDGSTSTGWYSVAGSPPHWITFDLGGIKCIDEVRSYHSFVYFPMTMDVQVSDDGSTWTTVAAAWRLSGSTGWQNRAFSPVAGRYIRLYQTAVTLNLGNCVEFQAHTSP